MRALVWLLGTEFLRVVDAYYGVDPMNPWLVTAMFVALIAMDVADLGRKA